MAAAVPAAEGFGFGPGLAAVVRAAVGLAGALRAGALRAGAGLAAGLAAAAAGLAAAFSSSATRRDSTSTSLRSPRTSSSTRRSSKLSRIRWAADATSSSRVRPRSRAPSVPPAVAWKVRSTAPRTASTTSAGSRPSFFLVLLFLSFLAMVAAVYGPVTDSATIHLVPHADVAERVLLPGDPGRALRLAQVLLEPPKMLNHNRGLWGYTGAGPDGEPLTIQSTGMGGPTTAIVVEELIQLGARRLVRVGTCGAIADGLELGQHPARRRRARRGRHEPGARRRAARCAPIPTLHAALVPRRRATPRRA